MKLSRFELLVERRLLRAFASGRIFLYLTSLMVLIVFAFATVMRIFDPEDFETFGTALWWAVATVTTVGYGDVVPTTTVGRAIASGLMISGFAFLSLITGTIASVLVSRLGASTRDQRVLEAIAQVEERLARLEERPPA